MVLQPARLRPNRLTGASACRRGSLSEQGQDHSAPARCHNRRIGRSPAPTAHTHRHCVTRSPLLSRPLGHRTIPALLGATAAAIGVAQNEFSARVKPLLRLPNQVHRIGDLAARRASARVTVRDWRQPVPLMPHNLSTACRLRPCPAAQPRAFPRVTGAPSRDLILLLRPWLASCDVGHPRGRFPASTLICALPGRATKTSR